MNKTTTSLHPKKLLPLAIIGVSALSLSVASPAAAITRDDDNSPALGNVERQPRDLDQNRDSGNSKPNRSDQAKKDPIKAQPPSAAAIANRSQPASPPRAPAKPASGQLAARSASGTSGGAGLASVNAVTQPSEAALYEQPVTKQPTAKAPPSLSVADAPPAGVNRSSVLGALSRKAGSFFAYGPQGLSSQATLLLYLLAGGLAAGGLVLVTGRAGHARQGAVLPQGLRQQQVVAEWAPNPSTAPSLAER